MAQMVTYEGYNYLIIPVYANNFYTRRYRYHILTNNQKYCGAIINSIVGYSEVEPKWKHDENYKKNPSIFTELKPYYTCDFKEDRKYETEYDFSNLIDEEGNKFPVDTDSYYELEVTYPYDD